ncbi:pyruvate,phosphate dikinase, partial [Wolbachia endosymbiont of Drosophila ananassae]
MCNVGIPVPPGFTISTSACKVYYQDNRSSVIQVSDYSDPEKNVVTH